MATGQHSTRGVLPFSCEYDTADHWSTVWRAQMLFLDIVQAHVPEVLQTLLSDVAPHYPAFPSCPPDDPGTQERRPQGEGQATAGSPSALQRWARHWNLDVYWVHWTAHWTILRHYHPLPSSGPLTGHDTILCWEHPALGYRPPLTDAEVQHRPDLALQLPTYKPWRQKRKQVEGATRAAFDAYLTEYLDRLDQMMKQGGWRKGKGKQRQEHFAWLALYQVKGLTYEQVAQLAREEAAKGTCGVPPAYPEKGVKREIKRTAKLVGLKLRGTSGPRPSATSHPARRRGRPPGSKNVH